MDKHTSGDWWVSENGTQDTICARREPEARYSFVVVNTCGYKGEREANAARIVACVNALAGINPDAVPDMKLALKACIDELCQHRIHDAARWTQDFDLQQAHAGLSPAVIAARAALAKAEVVQ